MMKRSSIVRLSLAAIAVAVAFGIPEQAVASGAPYQLYQAQDGSLLCGNKCLGVGYVCCNIVPQ